MTNIEYILNVGGFVGIDGEGKTRCRVLGSANPQVVLPRLNYKERFFVMEIGIRLLGAFELFLTFLAWPVYFLLSFRRKKKLPPMQKSLLNYSATLLAEKIRKKEISSEEVVKAYIERCREVNPILNAIVEDRFEAAIKEAQAVDALIYSGSKTSDELERDTPFLGVPLTVKESCGVKGMSHCVGCLPRKGLTSSEDGEAVGRMRKAGAIILAVTNTPELCLCWETTNLITGTTNNPYNPYRTCGGSSGGEAALLGAGASVIGIGSDIAGSIRVPAMFCGIYGHKPSPGFVPVDGHFPTSPDENFEKFLVLGPMTRFAVDLRTMLKVMSGENATLLKLDQKVDLSKLKLFFKEDAGFSLVTTPVDHQIRTALHNAVYYLRTKHGCIPMKADLEEFEVSVEISTSVFLNMDGIPDLLKFSKKEKPDLYFELLKSIFGVSEFSVQGLLFMILSRHNAMIPKSKSIEYSNQNEALRSKINKILSTEGVLLYPTFPMAAFHHNEYMLRTAGVMYTMIFNCLQLPSTHVPLGFNSDDLPIGIQVVGASGQDRLCLAVAEALEKGFGGWKPPRLSPSEIYPL